MRWWLVGTIAGVVCAGSALAAPFAWLAHESSASVSRTDLATHTGMLIAVGDMPTAVAATDDSSRAFVANGIDGTVSVIDGTTPTPTVITTLSVGGFLSGIAVTPDGAKAYVTSGQDVIVIDGVTPAVGQTIPTNGSLVTAVMNRDGTRLYVSKTGSVQSVLVIDTATDAVISDVFVSSDPLYSYALAVSADGTRVYVAGLGSDLVHVIDATTNLAVDAIALGGSMNPAGLVVHPDGSRVYVAEFNTSELAVLDPAAATVITTIPVGNQPRSVDVVPDGSRAYVANAGDGSLSIIDTANNTNVGTVLTLDPNPVSLGHFIVPGSTTSTSTSSSTTSSSSIAPTTSSTTATTMSTTTSTLAPVPLLSSTALVCQKTLGLSFKRYAAKAHGVFVTCFQKVLGAVASGDPTSEAADDCLRDLDPGVATAKILRFRTAAKAQILVRCATTTPAALANPCDPGATTMTEVADCVLDAQLARVTDAVAAEYGRPCSIATAAGLAAIYPRLCPVP